MKKEKKNLRTLFIILPICVISIIVCSILFIPGAIERVAFWIGGLSSTTFVMEEGSFIHQRNDITYALDVKTITLEEYESSKEKNTLKWEKTYYNISFYSYSTSIEEKTYYDFISLTQDDKEYTNCYQDTNHNIFRVMLTKKEKKNANSSTVYYSISYNREEYSFKKKK